MTHNVGHLQPTCLNQNHLDWITAVLCLSYGNDEHGDDDVYVEFGALDSDWQV